MGIETGSGLGLAVFGTLVATFTTNNFAQQLSEAGLPAEKVTSAVDALKSAIQGGIQQSYPTVSPEVLDELKTSLANAYTSSITSTLLISSALIFVTVALVWFGMCGRAGQPLADDGS